jgi:hypothetical protein
VWNQLKAESARQNRSVFETSSTMALSAARSIPDGVRWLSASAVVGATPHRPRLRFGTPRSLQTNTGEIRETGYLTYAGRQIRPYVTAAARQFSPSRPSLTERLLKKIQDLRR